MLHSVTGSQMKSCLQTSAMMVVSVLVLIPSVVTSRPTTASRPSTPLNPSPLAPQIRLCWPLCAFINYIYLLTFQQLSPACSSQALVRGTDVTGIIVLLLLGWLASRVLIVLDSGAVGPGFKSQPRHCRVTVLGRLFTPILPLFTKQRNW